MKKFVFIFCLALIAFSSCSTMGFSTFGQVEKKTIRTLEGDYTVEQLCIAPRTARWNMSELWLSKGRGIIIFIASYYNPQRFDKITIPIAIDGKVFHLNGATNFNAEIWGYTRASAGGGGTLYTNTVSVIITDEIKSLLKESSEIKFDLSVPSQERFEIIEGENLEKIKMFLP
jgi:hypothetical protein